MVFFVECEQYKLLYALFYFSGDASALAVGRIIQRKVVVSVYTNSHNRINILRLD